MDTKFQKVPSSSIAVDELGHGSRRRNDGSLRERWVEIVFVYLASILGLAIHSGALLILVGWLQMHVFLAKVAATAVTFLWNFATRYFRIFDQETSNA